MAAHLSLAWFHQRASGVHVAHAGAALFGSLCAASLLAGVSLCLLLPGLPPRGVLWCCVLVGGGLAWRANAGPLRGGRVLGVLLLGMALAGLQAAHALQAQLPVALQGQSLILRGQIVELPVHEVRRTSFEFVVDTDISQPASLRGQRLRLAWYDDDPRPRARLQAGSRWEFPLKLRAPRGLRNPGGSDAEKYALAARISATGFVQKPLRARRLAGPSGIDAWREAMSARIASTTPVASSRFVQALALGDTRALDDTDWARLRAAGLTHLIAISGFHVGLVAGFCALLAGGLWWLLPALCRWLPRPFAAGGGAVLGAFGYALLTGMAVPTMRTVVMIAVLVLARCLRRRQRIADTLGLGCIVLLLLDPLAVLGAGFWLSFAGVAWLLWCLPGDAGEGGGKGIMPILRGFFAAQAVASLGLLPLTVVLFGQASFAGPLANLAAVPWWSLVVVPLSLLGVLAETLHAGAGPWCWQAAAWCFDLLWPVLTRIADSPLAMLWLPEARWFALPLALLSAFWLLLPRGLPGKPLVLLLWLPLLLPARELPAVGAVELTVIDVGQGLSVLVRTAHHSLLYDMGPAVADGYDAGERAVIPALHGLGVRHLDLAMVSHGDNDHAGGLQAVASVFPIPQVWVPAGSPTHGTARCVAGQQWQWDGVRFRVLHPAEGMPYLDNESSCVLRIETATDSALLAGDIGQYVERKLLAEQPASLRNAVVIVPHHGSAGSSDPGFVSATGARLALVSSGADNRFRHPREAVVRRWCAAGAEVLDTSRSGALQVWIGRQGLQLRERRSDQPRLWDAVQRRGQAAGLCYAPEILRP
ncbi:MAG TPA: DNA internalization-related competence protein ComEC/Rec2 [Thermomonas sp.]|jgi:competence protein ComEC|uniref:DNA internalization-related competence protein ComEC/Rec2 n=1 Tax=Thermomonas sp. TaxID=1971895 RepID=UPI002C0FE7D8|nr:DNA internalization-related competence protein ComEC/Rec2 [Thermomonas sp.]HOC10439.1 DNA internalization-related competence protein ComEC/Rec2 [Thermomonas sp.]